MTIPFCKAHGDRNDFLISWADEAAAGPEIARAICARHTGVGADGWILLGQPSTQSIPSMRIFNSDGSEPEISGNGTRCAAAFLIHHGIVADLVAIRTGAGVKQLRLLNRDGLHFLFEMNMGRPRFVPGAFSLPLAAGPRDVTLVDVGNPQCAVAVNDFEFDWRKMGAEIERHPHFPNRTNVSFLRVLDRHAIEVRFFERGAGETMSSGTGSTGAVAAAMRRGWVESPVTVKTPAGALDLRGEDELYLTGPAEIVAEGLFHLPAQDAPSGI